MARPLAVALVVAFLPVASCAAFSPMQAYASLSQNTKRLVDEQKYANALRQQRKLGKTLDYADFDAIQTANADVGKMINVLWLGLYAKFYTPLALYFYPGMLPSAYESEAGRGKRLAEAEKKRRLGLTRLLAKVDDAAAQRLAVEAGTAKARAPKAYDLTGDDVAAAIAALSARGPKAAVDALGTRRGDALPHAALLAASLAMEGPYKFLPRWMHKRAVNKGVTTLIEGDDALRVTDLAALPRPVLENACAARGLLRPTTAEMHKGLRTWLKIADAADAAGDEAAAKEARLALLAVNTAASIRASAATATPGVAALYAGTGY